MALETMYEGKSFSPSTILTQGINDTATRIYVEDIDAFPDAPNLAVLGETGTGEVIKYFAKGVDFLDGVQRGVDGVQQVWNVGDKIARNFTKADYDAMRQNIIKLSNEKLDSDGIADDSEKLGGNLPAWYQQSTNGLSAETALVDADTLPFYDASASAGRKTTWSNLKSILKAYFDDLYTAALLLLTGYTKPAQSAAVAATDSIRTAIGKLERGLDDKAASIHASRHSEGGADAISPADIGAAVPAADLTANLAVASWAGASAPYTQTVSGLSGVTANSKLDIGLAETATDAQFTEAVAAQIRATGSGTGTVTFKAHGTKPTDALPILIRMVD